MYKNIIGLNIWKANEFTSTLRSATKARRLAEDLVQMGASSYWTKFGRSCRRWL
jgi:hypothetical protein